MPWATHRFSLRRLPFEGGTQAIFDNVTGKFIGSNGEIFRYAEHSKALKDLNGFQRVNGFAEANIFTTENGKEYHEGDTLFASFEGKEGVHLEIERIDEHDVWYTMPSEPGQEAVSMDRYEYEKYLDKGNISLLFSRYPILNDDRTHEERAADRAEEAEPHIERELSREPTELEVAKKLIEDYCAEEYNSESVDFSDLTNIGIGYTTITDDEIPIQVVVNLVDFKIEKYLADDIVEVSKYDSLHDLIEYELNNLVFDALISVSDDLIEQYNEKYGNGIPQFVEKEKPRKTFMYNTHPEIPDSEKHNYHITDNEIGMGGAKEKFRKNIAAINLLHELEFDNRLATPEEQEILAQYSGWGGLADAFDETKDNWHSEFTELYTTLSPEEYEAAKESTLTAFYTPPVVIKAMYKALENMGFVRGNVLEPSCGIGNFMGLIPESMDAKIMEKMQLDADVAKLKLQKADHLSQRYSLEDALIKKFPREIAEQEERIKSLIADMETAKNNTFPNENGFSPMVIMGTTYTEKAEAGKAILAVCERINSPDERPLGKYRGFKMEIGFDTLSREFFINLRGKLFHKVPLGQDANGIITRLDNAIEAFEKRKQGCEFQLEELHKQVENAKAEIAKPFPRESELDEKCKRLAELNAELNMDRRENEIVDGADEQSEEEQEEKRKTRDDRDDR